MDKIKTAIRCGIITLYEPGSCSRITNIAVIPDADKLVARVAAYDLRQRMRHRRNKKLQEKLKQRQRLPVVFEVKRQQTDPPRANSSQNGRSPLPPL